MQGGLHPELDICWFEKLFADVKERYPTLHLHCLSPPEVAHIAQSSGLTVAEALRRLRAAGLDSLPGGGAEILVDRVRTEVSPHKIGATGWLDVMREAHRLGMKSTATMMFGSLDTPAERIEHLRRIRDLQDETGGFTAFIAWTFQAGNTRLEAGHRPATGWDYLRMLAVARLYLDNVANVQASWVTQGLRMGQVSLAFGANDMGSTMIEENVVKAAGVSHTITVPEMVRLIAAAGFRPVQRDTLYREVRRY
jgi:cyclic dehypoxanthinyl futalosine synthase